MGLVTGTSEMLEATRGVGGIGVDVVVLVVDESVFVCAAGGEVDVWTAHGCTRQSRAAAESGGRVNVAERVGLVTVVDEVVLTIETGVGTIAVVLVKACGS